MSVPQTPPIISMFGQPCKVPGLFNASAVDVDSRFGVRNGEQGEAGGDSVDAHRLAPSKDDPSCSARQTVDRARGSFNGRKHKLAIGGHEKCRAVGEMRTPTSRPAVGHIVGHGSSKGSHTGFHLSGVRRGDRFEIDATRVLSTASDGRSRDNDPEPPPCHVAVPYPYRSKALNPKSM